MHMADALVSPAVGGAMWALSASGIAYCSARVRRESDDRKVPLMGVLGAFIFAAQMVNFTIPGTGSSGHLGGGLLLAILLGPHAAFLTIASVLVVQAFFFADGGLLALGCNIFNLGFFPAFIAYPLIYSNIASARADRPRITAGAVVASVAGLQLGAFCVVLETVASGISALPLWPFAALMQPIHLAIGIVEGVATATVVSFVCRARPELLAGVKDGRLQGAMSTRKVAWVFLALALVFAGLVSGVASKKPDGLEWSIKEVMGKEKLEDSRESARLKMDLLQGKLAFLPGYDFKKPEASSKEESELGTSLSGVAGSLLCLGVALLIPFMLKMRPAPGSGKG